MQLSGATCKVTLDELLAQTENSGGNEMAAELRRSIQVGLPAAANFAPICVRAYMLRNLRTTGGPCCALGCNGTASTALGQGNSGAD